MFKIENGKTYWYENGARQGTMKDPKNIKDAAGVPRGREIYDPDTDAWYWLDACNDGAVAKSKEVWMPYVTQGLPSKTGKWVRYDRNGRMVKGWCGVSIGNNQYNFYYYDKITGAMVKDYKEINNHAWDNIRKDAVDPTNGYLTRVHTKELFDFNVKHDDVERSCTYV